MNINTVTISGNITRDAELRAIPNGTSVLRFCVAVNDRRKVGDNWEDKPNFIECSLFGKRAEYLERRLAKGCPVVVQGKLTQNTWETKDGQKRSEIRITANEVMCVERGEKVSTSYPQHTQKTDKKSEKYSDENIPF